MRSTLFLLLAAALLRPALARAEGGFLCQWSPGTTQVRYAAFGARDEIATDVRAMLQAAVLVDAAGRFPEFPSLTPRQPERLTEPLLCEAQSVAADGVLQLTFTRRVRLGIEYTLGRCQLFYHCAATPAATAPVAPQPILELSRSTSLGAPPDEPRAPAAD